MRPPIVAGRFYSKCKDDLLLEIKNCFNHKLGPGLPGECSNERKISAVVAPHAGYAASGMNAAHVYRKISEDGLPEAYVIIGPDHYGVPFDYVMSDEEYLTPLGICKIHRELAEKFKQYIQNDPASHKNEHSIEVQIPFIQYMDPDPQIIPIIMSKQDIRTASELSKIINEVCKEYDIIIIASSDMAHYVPKLEASFLNYLVLDKFISRDIEGMYSVIDENNISVCGYGTMATTLMAINPSSVELLKYSDSWDSLNYNQNSVVGYGSLIMLK